jgi:mRNA interferase RelE/StbE
MASDPYKIVYAREAADELRALRSFDKKKILEGIELHLRHEPTKVSRSRIKRMAEPFWSQYRLRMDDFRVYYDVDDEDAKVTILRILEKGIAETPKHEKEPKHEED